MWNYNASYILVVTMHFHYKYAQGCIVNTVVIEITALYKTKKYWKTILLFHVVTMYSPCSFSWANN